MPLLEKSMINALCKRDRSCFDRAVASLWQLCWGPKPPDAILSFLLEIIYIESEPVYNKYDFLISYSNIYSTSFFWFRQTSTKIAPTSSICHEDIVSPWLFFCTSFNVTVFYTDCLRKWKIEPLPTAWKAGLLLQNMNQLYLQQTLVSHLVP